MLAKYHSPPQVFVHDFAISSIVESSLVTSLSNHDGRIMPSNHVQQNPGLHTTLKPAVNDDDERGRGLWTYNLEGARICHTEEEFQQRINAVSSGS